MTPRPARLSDWIEFQRLSRPRTEEWFYEAVQAERVLMIEEEGEIIGYMLFPQGDDNGTQEEGY